MNIVGIYLLSLVMQQKVYKNKTIQKKLTQINANFAGEPSEMF